MKPTAITKALPAEGKICAELALELIAASLTLDLGPESMKRQIANLVKAAGIDVDFYNSQQ